MRQATGEERSQLQITVGEAFTEVQGLPIVSLNKDIFGALTVKIGETEFAYAASFSADLLHAILSLHKNGFESFGSRWFWYDSDYAADAFIRKSYSFFVVSGNKIVLEDVTLVDYNDNGFNPEALEPPNYEGYYWSHQPNWEEAWIKYWYRKFYRETATGQLMVLRPDKPPLHHFSEGRWSESTMGYVLGEQLVRIRRSLYLLVILGVAILLTLILSK